MVHQVEKTETISLLIVRNLLAGPFYWAAKKFVRVFLYGITKTQTNFAVNLIGSILDPQWKAHES